MLCEGHLGIETHFALWRWLFQIVPSKPRSSGRYLEFNRGHNYDTELGWQKSWFYLPNMVSVLSPFSSERLGAHRLQHGGAFPWHRS
jgi:hypothetical protein